MYNEYTIELYRTIIEVTSFFSVFGCLFIMFTFLAFNKLQSSHNKLIFFLGLTDLIYSGSYLLTMSKEQSQEGLICTLQGCMMQFAFNATSLVILTISFSLYQKIVKASNTVDRNFKYFMLACFAIPGLISAYFIYKDAFVPLGYWCFIDMQEDYIETLLSVHLIYIISTLITTFFYIRTILWLRSEFQSSQMEIYMKVYSRIKWYPILLILCFSPIIVFRHLDHFGIKINQWLLVGAGALACLNGFLNGVFYGFNKNTRKSLCNCCCKKRQKSEIQDKLL